jgi:glycosyltransferase involved in cell wall biosynthesis
MKRFSIAYLVPSLSYGGSEKLLHSFLKYLDRDKFLPEVHCFYDNGELVEEFRKNKIEVYNWHAPKRDPITFFRMILFFRRRGYDIAHTHLFDRQGRVAAFLSGIPVIITTYHLVTDWDRTGGFSNWFKVWLDTLTSRLNDQIITVSEAVREQAIVKGNISPKKITTILNGVDLEEYSTHIESDHIRKELGLEGKRIIVAVGRLVPQKGHVYLIRAARLLIKDFPNLVFLIIGDGPLLDTLESEIRENELEGVVRLLGNRSDIPEILSCSEIYVMPSIYEGLSISLLETMASEKPIVTTNVNGIQGVIDDGYNGLLVSPRKEADLARALSLLLKDRNLAAELARMARKKVEEEYDIRLHVRRIENMYLDLLKKKGR